MRRKYIPYVERERIRANIMRGLSRLFTDIPPDTADEILYSALKQHNPGFLKLTTIRLEEPAPASELARLAELELENKRLIALLNDEEMPDEPGGSRSELQELIKESIIRGLEKDNAQMVGKALEYIQDLEAKEFLSELNIEIVPYTIKDTSLEEIILRAPEEIVAVCEQALVRRRKEGQTDPHEPLTWEREHQPVLEK